MDYIKTRFKAVVSHEAGTYETSEHDTRAEALAAASDRLAEVQAWVDDEWRAEVLRAARDNAVSDGNDPDTVEIDVADAESRVECLQYEVGDDDITDDPVAQAIVETVIGTPHVRWPASREGDRAGRPTRLLFADHPVRDQWGPIDIADSEVMLAWFLAHGLEYPQVARNARRIARQQEHMSVRDECLSAYRNGPGLVLGAAEIRVARLKNELAAAQAVLLAADADAAAARIRRDQNIQWHAEAMAKRPAV